MKRISILLVFILLLITGFPVSARVFFIGSSPFLSIIAFPQDVLLFTDPMISYSLGYKRLPWWGDVDEPGARPNESYTSTKQDVSFVRAEGDDEDSHFSQAGAIHTLTNHVQYTHFWNPQVVQLFSFGYDLDSLSASASGNLRAQDGEDVQFIPFEYQAQHLIGNFDLQTILGFPLGGLPFGIKGHFGFQTTHSLENSFSAEVDGEDIESNRLLWGWSTTGCNKIFGYSHINGDAWFQNSYSIGPLYQLDFQLGLTLPDAKIGGRFRYATSEATQYEWQADEDEDILVSHFEGEYEAEKWARTTRDIMGRIYSNVTWKRTEQYALNTLFFLGYERRLALNTLAENTDIEKNSRETSHHFILEANPNVNLFLGRGVVIDAALLLEYGRARFDNTHDYWISGVGGETEGYWNSAVYLGDEYWWESFSYADESFVDFGLDCSMMLPIFRRPPHDLALTLIFFLNSKFTYLSKAFGVNEMKGDDLRFSVDNYRDNFRREIWLNTVLGLAYRSEKIAARLDFFEPLIYSLFFRTFVTDPDRDDALYKNEVSRNLAVQEGFEIRLTMSFLLK